MPDASWLRARLAPLMGLAGAAGDREQVFTGWQRFLEGIAESTPLVLVFEDIHWADSTMLDFLRHLAEWSSGVPMLVLCTSRPELLDTHPGWASDLTNAPPPALKPLGPDETSQLVAALLAAPGGHAGLTDALSRRCGG